MKADLKLGFLFAAAMLICIGGEVARAGVELVSVGVGGAPANGDSFSNRSGASSANGRFVVFSSVASNLVPSDTNGQYDVFVRDRSTRTIRLVSLSSGGAQGDGSSEYGAAISADGRLVAFMSAASNLVPGDTNARPDVFVRDLRAGTTKRISVATDGTEGNGFSFSPSLSGNGRYVAFHSESTNLVPGDTNGSTDVFLHDLQNAATLRVSLGAPFSQAKGSSYSAALSYDARFVAFESRADNLVPGDTNRVSDIFVRDRRSHTVRRVSLAQGGAQISRESRSPAMTPDGRYVMFASDASGVVPGDTNGVFDIFVRDLQANTTNRVSLRTGGFSEGARSSLFGSISADGKRVAFHSYSRFAPGDKDNGADVYLRDRRTLSTQLLSVALPDVPAIADGMSSPAVSADGSTVVFTSSAANLVPGDTNGVRDMFVATP
jgi:Tol biopolymer transport system component